MASRSIGVFRQIIDLTKVKLKPTPFPKSKVGKGYLPYARFFLIL